MRNLAIVGCGYVGLVTGTCFAELGNAVVCVDVDAGKVQALQSGAMPFYEPALGEMIARNLAAGRLSFTTDIARAVAQSEVIFIAVGTPMGADGRPDLTAIGVVARDIGLALDGPRIIVSKSTVPVDTGDVVRSIVTQNLRGDHAVTFASNPEFLREGSAVADFLEPDRIVIGTRDAHTERVLRELYAPLGAPIMVTDVRTAEMIKYAANAFLATKISFMNEIANICEGLGVDVRAVGRGIGYDRRIGTECLNPGLGYGGSCFPKDLRALERIAAEQKYGAPLLHAVAAVNDGQIGRILDTLGRLLGGLAGRTVAVLGLSFKPNTDDVRNAPALAIIARLRQAGSSVRAYDPIAVAGARAVLGDDGIAYCADAYAAIGGSDAVLLATEWNEFRTLDFARCALAMRGDLVMDGRNIFDPDQVSAAGLRYVGIGRAAPRDRAADGSDARAIPLADSR